MRGISLNDLSDYDLKYRLRFCQKSITATTYINMLRFLNISKSLDFDWQPKIDFINKDTSNYRYCMEVIGFGQHGFAVFSNNGKVIKITDDITEINYLFFWNYMTCSSEDKLMVPIYKFHLDKFDDGLHILWKDYALEINDENPVSEEMQDEFFTRMAKRYKFIYTQDYGLHYNQAKNLGIHNGSVVFYDSGYNKYKTELYMNDVRVIYKTIDVFAERVNTVTDIEELKSYMRGICKNKKGIVW